MRELKAAAVLWPPDTVLDASATREAVEEADGGSLAVTVTKRKQPYFCGGSVKEMYETWILMDCVLVSCYPRDVRNMRKVSQGVLLVFGRPFEDRVVAAMQAHGFALPC